MPGQGQRSCRTVAVWHRTQQTFKLLRHQIAPMLQCGAQGMAVGQSQAVGYPVRIGRVTRYDMGLFVVQVLHPVLDAT